MTHHYLTTHTDLTEIYNIPVILYDQLGSGSSTHLTEKARDTTFWTEELFIGELENLIAHINLTEYDILGSSWGGMMSSRFASRRPKGLRRFVIANSPADMKLRYQSSDQYRLELPADIQAIHKKHEDAGTEDSDENQEAMDVFMKRHICSLDPIPECLLESIEHGKDKTSVDVLEGTRQWTVAGSPMENWSMIEDCKKISVPTLLINGDKEIASDLAFEPWTKIPGSRWVKMMGSKHCPHLEEREKYMKVVGDFLIED